MKTEFIYHLRKVSAIRGLSNIFWTTLSTAVPFLTIILITTYLTVQEFGTFSLFLSFFSIFGGLCFGLRNVSNRYIAAYADNQDQSPDVLKFLVFITISRILLFALLLTLLFLITKIGVIDIERFHYPYIFLSIVMTVFFSIRFIIRDALLHGYMDHVFHNSADAAVMITKVLLVFLLRPTNTLPLIWIWLMLEVIRVFTFGIRLNTLYHRNRKKSSYIKLEYRKYFDYGKFFFLASIATTILAFDMDNLFIAYYLGRESVGLYSFSNKVALLLLGFAPSYLFFNIITPYFIKISGPDRYSKKTGQLTEMVFKGNMFFFVLILFFFLANIDLLVDLFFAGKYKNSMGYIYTLLPFIMIATMKKSLEPVHIAAESSKVFTSAFVGAVLNILGNFILIPVFGVYGAILSTGASIFLQFLWFYSHTERKTSFRMPYGFLSILLFWPITYFLFGRISFMTDWCFLAKVAFRNSFAMILSGLMIIFLLRFRKQDLSFLKIFYEQEMSV